MEVTKVATSLDDLEDDMTTASAIIEELQRKHGPSTFFMLMVLLGIHLHGYVKFRMNFEPDDIPDELKDQGELSDLFKHSHAFAEMIVEYGNPNNILH